MVSRYATHARSDEQMSYPRSKLFSQMTYPRSKLLKAHVAPVQRPLRKRLSRTAAPAFLATASPL